MPLRIGMTYNSKTEYVLKPEDPPDMNAEFDHDDTINVIEQALISNGHEVIRIGNAQQLLERTSKLDVDIVFNFAEGYFGRNRESQVPILLEMMQVPYVGADGLTLGLTLDKVLTKKVLLAEGIPTPRYFEITDVSSLDSIDLKFPLIVKLRCEGSSKGLSDRSLVDTLDALKRQVNWLLETYKQSSVFVEEFIEGSEFTVAIIGNEKLQVYPVIQIQLDGQMDLGRKFFTFSYLRRGSDYICPAPIPEALRKRMQDLAVQTYRAVDCRDFGRVDFRVDAAGNPYVLEINPLPSLSIEDVFNFIAKNEGVPYAQIINRVLEASVQRCGLRPRDERNVLSATPSH